MRGVAIPWCLVAGCRGECTTHLGVCTAHWQALPGELRAKWWDAWQGSARVKDWGRARKNALAYLAGRAS